MKKTQKTRTIASFGSGTPAALRLLTARGGDGNDQGDGAGGSSMPPPFA